MAHSAEETRSYAVSPAYFQEKVRGIANAGLNLIFRSENPTDTGVWYRIHHGMSALSYGELITITLTYTATGTDVKIHSECAMPTQLMDGGKNKNNIRLIYEYLEKGLAARPAQQPYPAQQPVQQAAPQPVQQPVQQAAPQPAPQPQRIFCAQCGKENLYTSNFCAACGNRLIKP